MRIKSCKLQQEDPELKKINLEIEKISNQIKDQTSDQRDETKKLTETSQSLNNGDPEGKVIAKKLKVLDASAKRKTKDLRDKLSDLNKKLQKAMSKNINEAKPLVEELSLKQKELKDKVAPRLQVLNKTKDQLTRLISENKDVVAEFEKFTKMREDLRKASPCDDSFFETEQSWIDIII